MGYIGRGQPDRVLTSADIGEGAVTLADISFTDQPSNVNITGDYPKQTMRLCDNATVTGDVTIGDGLILAKLASDGDSITLTSDGTTRTISGTGLIEANTIAQSPNQSLTGMTGTLGTGVFPTGHIIQVKQSVMSTKQVVSSADYVDVLSCAITPASSGNKILINFSIGVGAAGGGEGAHIRIERDGSPIGVGDARGNRGRATVVCGQQADDSAMGSGSGMYLDSPNSTSSLTYTIAVHGWSSSHPVNINCTGDDTNSVNYSTTISTLTLQEIQG